MKCPFCRKSDSSAEDGISPFCSKRCKTLDLGAWASESYRIAGSTKDDTHEELAEESGRAIVDAATAGDDDSEESDPQSFRH